MVALFALALGVVSVATPNPPGATGVEIVAVRLQIYSLSGQTVYDSGFQPRLTLQWNLQTQRGDVAANGVYLYVVTAKDAQGRLMRSPVRKLVVLR